MKCVIAMSLAVMTVACGGGAGSETPSAPADQRAAAVAEAPKAPEPPPVHEVTIPAGTTLRLDLGTALASDTSTVEQPVRASVRQAVLVNGEPVIPVGAEVAGMVTGVERAGRVKGRAAISYRFSTLSTDGETYTIKTSPLGHQAEA